MRTVLTSIVDAVLRARVHAELRSEVRVEDVGGPDALATVACRVEASAVIVELPGDFAAAATILTALQEVRRCTPGAHRIVVCRLSSGVSKHATAVVRTDAGVLVLHPIDDVIAVTRRELGISSGDSVAQQLLQRLVPALAVSAEPLVRYVIRRAESRITVADFARAMQRTPRTLLRWCAAAGLPTPVSLIAWGRLMVVLQLADSRGLTLERAALRCGFSGAHDVHTRLRRVTGLTRSAVRNQGGLSALFIRRFGRTPFTARAERSLRIEVVPESTPVAQDDAVR